MNSSLKSLMDDNFLEYASYVIKDRAIPHIDDGLKPVQRRILHTLREMHDGKFHKVANVVGRTMQYHPHGDASIFAALVGLANKDYFIEKQGNFGSILTGDSASAARYIECRLTPLAMDVLFNKDITAFVPSYDGRHDEPVTLPAKIPVLLLHGADGIAVGMATHILPHNFNEVLQAQIAYLKQEPFELLPDFPQGGLMDASNYQDGNGKVRIRARVDAPDEKHLVIREIPFGTTTEKLIASIEAAIRKNRIKVSAIQDYTAENVEIELSLPRGVYAHQVQEALYAFTDCEINHSVSLTVIRDEKPELLGVTDVITAATDKLVADLTREYELELSALQERLHLISLERLFIENRLYKKIENQETYEGVIRAVFRGLEPFRPQLVRDVTQDDVERLLQIKIKRISKFDINKSRKEAQDVKDRMKEVQHCLSDMTVTTILYLQHLLEKHGPGRERRTEVEEFERVRREDVAVQSLRISYDPEKGYLGTDVKGAHSEPCSPFDKILIIQGDQFKVIPAPQKQFVGHDLLFFGVVDKNKVFNCLYREQTTGLGFLKRFRVEQFILEREYKFVDNNCKVLVFLPDPPPKVKVIYPRAARVRVTREVIDFNDVLIKHYSAKGRRVSNKPVMRVQIMEHDMDDEPS